MASPTSRRILCVDNSPDDCELLRFVLADMGYEVDAVQTVAEGVRLAQNNPPDLYLLDVTLEDGTGFDLIAQVQTFATAAPIVICSADVRDSTRQQAIESGAQAFLTKPVNLDVLTATVAQLLAP